MWMGWDPDKLSPPSWAAPCSSLLGGLHPGGTARPPSLLGLLQRGSHQELPVGGQQPSAIGLQRSVLLAQPKLHREPVQLGGQPQGWRQTAAPTTRGPRTPPTQAERARLQGQSQWEAGTPGQQQSPQPSRSLA